MPSDAGSPALTFAADLVEEAFEVVDTTRAAPGSTGSLPAETRAAAAIRMRRCEIDAVRYLPPRGFSRPSPVV